jgi:hypothetical protein
VLLVPLVVLTVGLVSVSLEAVELSTTVEFYEFVVGTLLVFG